MKKKIINLAIIFILTFLFALPSVNASTYYGVVTGNEVKIRKNINNSNDYYKLAYSSETYDMPDNELLAGTTACTKGWYKVIYNGNVGYICSQYLQVYENNTTTNANCEQEMQKAGFPSNYWNGLCTLKSKYPNWQFIAIDTKYDFADAVSRENCKNSIYKNSSSSDYQDDTCSRSYDSGYTGASQTAVAYYMNPLNFLNERHIFMFESNYYNANVSDSAYNSTMQKVYTPNSYMLSNIPNFYTLINTASKESNVSSSAIVTRINQELGNAKLGYTYDYDNSALYSVISGNYTSRTGYYYNPTSKVFEKNNAYISVDNYYNFFNVAATDGSGVTQKALKYAYDNGWGGTGNKDVDRQIAMTGGAKFIYNWYTNAGQQTIYFNKFNVNPNAKSSNFLHQYMTNVEAPKSESEILYSGYQAAGALSSAFVFYIPIYTNLDAVITNTPGGATGDTTNSSTGLEPSTMIISSGLTLSGSMITGISKETNISDFKNKIASQGGTVSVLNGNSEINDGLIGTGMTVNVTSSSGTASYTAVVKGDTSGDGKVNALDLLQVQKNILGQYTLNNSSKLAADTSGDEKINALDLLQIQKNILGLYNL